MTPFLGSSKSVGNVASGHFLVVAIHEARAWNCGLFLPVSFKRHGPWSRKMLNNVEMSRMILRILRIRILTGLRIFQSSSSKPHDT